MVKQFKKSACFLTVLSLLLSFGFSSESSYATEKQVKDQAISKTLSSSQAMSEEDDLQDYYLNIDWGFDEAKYDKGELKILQELKSNGLYSYVVNNRNEAVITAYSGEVYNEATGDYEIIAKGDLVIPNTLGGYPVTMIYKNVFHDSHIQSLTIPEGVKAIGSKAICECDYLKIINIPSTVTAIDFLACTLNSSLRQINIPNDSVIEFAPYSLRENYALEEVTLPNTMTKIPEGLFQFCISLEKLDIPKGVTEIGSLAFAATGFVEFTIPDTINKIPEGMFYYARDLKKINIPDSVTEIGGAAFAGTTELTEITLPNSINKIPEFAFYDCLLLEKINMPNNVTEIGAAAFAHTAFTEFTVPDTVKTIGSSAFAGCENLVKLTIPKSVTQIDEALVEGCTKTVTIYGEKGSYAETYANNNKIPFKAINDTPEPELPVIATGVTTSTLKVRDGAGTTYTQIDYLAKGTKLEIVEKCDNGWYKIKNNGSYGYISGKYVRLDTTEELPVIATGVTTSTLKVRNGAGTGYAQIDYLAKGTKLEIVEKCSNGWYKIKNNGSYGYVSGKYVKLDSSEEVKVIATGVTTGDLNVRKGASTEYTRIGTLTKGTKVEIVEKLSNGWYKIKYNGAYGYVSGKYVKLDEQVSEVIATGVTTSGLNVREGSGTSYSKIGYLTKGTKVEIVEKCSNGWYKIKYNGSYGYISGKYVKLS